MNLPSPGILLGAQKTGIKQLLKVWWCCAGLGEVRKNIQNPVFVLLTHAFKPFAWLSHAPLHPVFLFFTCLFLPYFFCTLIFYRAFLCAIDLFCIFFFVFSLIFLRAEYCILYLIYLHHPPTFQMSIIPYFFLFLFFSSFFASDNFLSMTTVLFCFLPNYFPAVLQLNNFQETKKSARTRLLQFEF